LNEQSLPKFDPPSLGLFSWSLHDNRLVADEYYAGIYGLLPRELAEGVEIEIIMSCIVEEDRQRVAKQTHAAILSGDFGVLTFRVNRGSEIVQVGSYGRCLRDEEGTPSIFTGAVVDLSSNAMGLFNRILY
jgi:PAS domain-containing protein